jgi:hypothetical protein
VEKSFRSKRKKMVFSWKLPRLLEQKKGDGLLLEASMTV